MLIILATITLLFFVVSFFAKWALTYLENRFPCLEVIPADSTGIILLGGSFNFEVTESRKIVAYNQAASRIISFAELAHKNPTKRLVFSGCGSRSEASLNESSLAKKVLTNLGLNTEKIVFENHSKNTYENAIFSYKLLKPKPSEKWILVTSAFHMPRAVSLFRYAGFNIIPYPVDYHTTGLYNFQFSINLYRFCLDLKLVLSEFPNLARNYLCRISNTLIPEAF